MNKTQGPTVKLCRVQINNTYYFFYQKSDSIVSTPSSTIKTLSTSFFSITEANYITNYITGNKTKKILAVGISTEQIKQNRPELYI